MISNQVLQNTIEGIKNISHVELCVTDSDGREAAATTQLTEDRAKTVRECVASAADAQEAMGDQYFKIHDDGQLEYVLIAYDAGENTYTVGKLASFQIEGLLVAYRERFDKDNFIKNLLLDNLLLVDVYSRSKKLHIRTDLERMTMIVESEAVRDKGVLDIVKSYVGSSGTDFVTEVDENNVIIVKDVSELPDAEDLAAYAEDLLAHLDKEGVEDARVAYGTVVSEIKEVSRSYKEAKMALDVGRIFFAERRVICYSELGIGRLIYQLPIPLCKMFIREIFSGKTPDDFDEETLTTIDKFFENNLNVSETSRQLFIHRNTLVYRLDKLQKITGLDLRVFEDAITFKIALMVVKYMNYMNA